MGPNPTRDPKFHESQGGLIPPEPAASDSLGGGKRPKSQTRLVPFPKLPDRLGGSTVRPAAALALG